MAAVRQTVQPGTVAKLRVEVETSPVETGKAGAFVLREAVLDVDGTATSLVTAESWVMPAMVERAFRHSGAETASVTAAPVFSAASGPLGEDAWDVTVDSTVGFTVGDHVRATNQPDDEGQVFIVLSIPDGTSMLIHGKSGGCDIISGDTLEEVTSTGVYCGTFELDVDDYLDAGSPTGQLRILAQTVATGDAPAFDAVETLTWTFDLTLDIGSRQYRAG